MSVARFAFQACSFDSDRRAWSRRSDHHIKDLDCGSSILRLGLFIKPFVNNTLRGGSSGWTRTSNPAVNSRNKRR
jgi:hypothetical protein